MWRTGELRLELPSGESPLLGGLDWTSLNMSSNGEVCDSLGNTFLTSLFGNHGATVGLRVNSSSVKGGPHLSFPFFLLKGNAILPMTSKAGCEGGST